jgi:hypothetical protein
MQPAKFRQSIMTGKSWSLLFGDGHSPAKNAIV